MIRIQNYRCRGTQSAPGGEEYASGYEIVFPRAGVYMRHSRSESVVADANQVLFFDRGQPYRISHPITGGDRSTVFSLQQPLIQEILSSFDPAANDRPAPSFPLSHAIVTTRQRLRHYRLLQALDGGGLAGPLQIEEWALLLLADVIGDTYHRRSPTKERRRVSTARAHAELTNAVKLVLNERFRERVLLDQVARAVAGSPYHLCRVFRRQTGHSIHHYLQQLRLHAALEQLVEQPGEHLTDLALDLGFASHSHFSTAFQREFGLAPSSFRRTATVASLRQMGKILKARSPH